MSTIGEAFVAVRPDLSGFARELKKQLKDQKGTHQITVTAVFAKGTKGTLQKSLADMALRVPVTPFITKTAAAGLRKQLGQVPVDVVLAQGQAQKIGRQISSSGAVGSATASGTRSAQSAAAKQADLAVLSAQQSLKKESIDLATAEANLTAATEALALATAELDAAERGGLTNKIALAKITQEKAVATQAAALAARDSVAITESEAKALGDQALATELANAQMKILADTTVLLAGASEKEVTAALALEAALLKQATAVEVLAKARVTGATAAELQPLQAAVTTGALGVAGAERNVAAARDAANAPARAAAKAAAEAAQIRSAADTASITARSGLKASTTDLATAERALAAAEAAEVAERKALTLAQESGIKNEIELREATHATAVSFVRDAEAQIAAVEAQLLAEKKLQIARDRAVILQGTSTSGRPSRSDAKTAGLGAAAAGEAAAAAALAGNTALEAEAKTLQAQLALREKNLKTEIAEIPVKNRLLRIQEQIAVASDASSSATSRRRAAIQADRLAVKALDDFAKGTLVASDAQILLIKELEQKAVAQQAAAAADLEAAAASKKAAAEAARQVTTQAQVRRGAAATGASFLGLRGAVLSASTGFLAATVAVTGFAKIVKTAANLQQSLNVFQSVSGATAEQMAAIDAEAKALGADLTLPATSANDAAQAMTELSKAGLSVNDTLAATRGVLELAAAANISVGDATNIVATELNAFGLAGTEASKVANLLAGASVAAQGEITDFALAFQQVSAVAHQVQLPIETTTALLTQFAKAGLRGSDAGTSLRTLLLRLVPTTKAASEAQAELGIEIDRSIPIGQQFTDLVNQYAAALAKLDPIAQQESLTKIFGQDAIRGASISLTQSSQALEDVQAQVSASGQAAELANARMRGLTGAVEGLKSSLTTLAGSIGEPLLPALESIARTLAGITQSATDTAEALTDIGKVTIKPVIDLVGGTDVIAKVGLLAAAVLGARKLLTRGSKEEVTSAVAAGEANVIAAQTATQAWAAKTAASVAAAGTFEKAEVIAAEAAAEANIAAALASGEAWVASEIATVTSAERAGAALGRTAAQAKKLASANRALIAGVAATAVGSQVGGTAGGILSSVGQGAIGGALVGGAPGAVIGAGAGLFLAGLSHASAETAAKKASWDALSYAEQIQALTDIAGADPTTGALGPKASAYLSVLGLSLKSPPPPSIADQRSAQRIIPIPGLNAFATRPTTGLDTTSEAFRSFLAGIAPETSAVEKGVKDVGLGANLQAQLELALAQASGNTDAANKAIEKMIAAAKRQIAALRKIIDAFDPVTQTFADIEKSRAAVKKLVEAVRGLNALQAQLTKETFSIPVGLQISGINASATKTLQDDLANKKAIAAATTKALEDARNATVKDQATINDLRIKQAQASADVTNTQTQIAAQDKQDQQTRLEGIRAQLQFAADTAGNIGAAENKYIAFLRQQVTAEGKTTAEIVAAKTALQGELNKRKSALAAVAQASTDLTNARLANQLARAQATPGKKDDKTAFLAQITFNKSLIAGLRAEEVGLKKTSLAYKEKEIAVQGLINANIGLRNSIKDLNGDGGFSLKDLFGESIRQFQEFGSNVSSGPMDFGQVRGQFAKTLISTIANRPGDLKNLGLTTVAANTGETNKLLRDLISIFSGTQGGSKSGSQGTGSSTAGNARRFAVIRNAV